MAAKGPAKAFSLSETVDRVLLRVLARLATVCNLSKQQSSALKFFISGSDTFCGGKARTLASTEGFIYLFVRGFACVTWSSAKEPEAGDGKENEREPGDEVGGACRVEIGHIGFWRVVSCGFFLYCLKTVAGDSKDYGDVS